MKLQRLGGKGPNRSRRNARRKAGLSQSKRAYTVFLNPSGVDTDQAKVSLYSIPLDAVISGALVALNKDFATWLKQELAYLPT